MRAQPSSVDFLRLEGLSKSYGEHTALHQLDLQVRQGEFISLLGPSGCGKTTTLHMIAGFLEPDRGDIVLDGQSLRDVPSHRRGTAMVFQNYALFPHLSVFDNVAFGLKMARTPSREVALSLIHI